jgi:hypothetical protein
MINLQKLSLATLSAAILASVGGNAPAAAAQLFFNLSGNFTYQRFVPGPSSIYDELDRGSLTGFFSIDSEEDDTNPAFGQGTYELSGWQIDLLTPGGDLVGQLTSADGGSGEILVDVITRSPSSFTLIRTFIIEFQDVLTGGTRAGVDADLQLVKSGFSCVVTASCQEIPFEEFLEFINSPDNALPDVLPQEIIGSTSPFPIALNQSGNQLTFANESPTAGLFYVSADVRTVPPASVPEPGTAAGLGLVSLGWLLKKKVAFSQKTKATVKARQATSI